MRSKRHSPSSAKDEGPFYDARTYRLASLAAYLSLHYPSIVSSVEARIHAVIAHIAEWPESAPIVAQRAGIRMVPLGRYPYKIY